MNRIFILLPAGGLGVRFGGGVKKQFLKLGGETILNRTLKIFLALPEVTRIIVALPEDEIEEQTRALNHEKVMYVAGGGCRAASVRNAFFALKDVDDEDIVLVHDAVRPLVSAELIRRVVDGVNKNGTALPVIFVTDTIKSIKDGRVTNTVDRDSLGAAQTPQGAKHGLFKECYAAVGDAYSGITDEAMLWERTGLDVYTVPGERENIKVTTAFDLAVAEAVIGKE